MKKLVYLLLLLSNLWTLPAFGQQAIEFGEYVVHYNALNSSMITPEIARAYGINRSDSRGLLNISVLKKQGDKPAIAIRADVTANGRNLTGQTRTIEMREITEGDDAIYYIGEISVRNMETFDFTVMVTPQGQDSSFEVKFRQQFYTE